MDLLEQVKSSVDIVKVVGEYVRLKKAGGSPSYADALIGNAGISGAQFGQFNISTTGNHGALGLSSAVLCPSFLSRAAAARCFSRSVSANLIMLTSCAVVGTTAVYDFAYRTHPDL